MTRTVRADEDGGRDHRQYRNDLVDVSQTHETSRRLKKAHLRRWRPRPHAQSRERLRLACGSTQLSSRDGQGPPLNSNGGAPPRIWTLLAACMVERRLASGPFLPPC